MSTFTINKNFEQPAHGSYTNSWDLPVNADWAAIDNALAGHATINVTGIGSGTYALTVAQYIPPNLSFIGTISANLTYVLPVGVGWFGSVYNNTSGAFTLIFGVSGGGSIVCPQGVRTFIVCDGTNVQTADSGTLAASEAFAAAAAATAQSNAQSFATAADVVVTTNTEAFATSAANTAQSNAQAFATAADAVVTTNANAFATSAASTAQANAISTSEAFTLAQGYAPLASPALTGTPTAPTQGAGTNNTDIATTAFVQTAAGGTSSLAANGWQKFPSGLVHIWGVVSLSVSGTAYSFSTMSGINFPTSCFNIQALPISGGALPLVAAGVVSATGFTLFANAAGSYWIFAIGH
jgi:hypothetical protein